MEIVQKIIVGLGNPGKEYQATRHNAGFMVLDSVAAQLGCPFREQTRHTALVAECGGYTLLKPQTFMNLSGKAVQSWLRFYKLLAAEKDLVNLAVAYDDLDIPFGTWKWQFGRGPKAHNGVNSVVAHLGTDQFWHVRIGIENRADRAAFPPDAYVLSSFLATEQAVLHRVTKEARERLLGAW